MESYTEAGDGALIRLTLTRGREESVLRRHPWLFSGAVSSREGDGSDGLAEVLDAEGHVLAHGSYSPQSQIVARLWTFDRTLPGVALFRERFEAARGLRRQLIPPETTGLRLINGEGDLCPGVVLDAYEGVGVLDLSTEGTERWQAELTSAAGDVFSLGRIVVRRSGAERDRGRSRGALRSSVSWEAPPPEDARVSFTENGLHFFADLAAGQKTGFFLDQRENRSRLRAVAGGRSLLNLFSYSGAFSIAALAGGATRAVDVDASEQALRLGAEHRRANGYAIETEDLVRADVFEELRRRVARSELWDLVVCDPPAFAKKKGEVARAARGYQDINRLAMRLVAPGGWLLTCSCSGLLGPELFQKIVFAASVEAGRSFALVARQGAGPDHPVSLDCPEGEYLKGLWLRRAPA